MHCRQSQRTQVLARLIVQSAQAFDAVDLGRQLAEHRGLVATAGANFQHPAQTPVNTFAQQLDHARHYAGFGNSLPQPDGQAGVLIGLVGQSAIDKTVALHFAHGLLYQEVTEPLGHQLFHHAATYCAGIHAQALRKIEHRAGFGDFCRHAGRHPCRKAGPLFHAPPISAMLCAQ